MITPSIVSWQAGNCAAGISAGAATLPLGVGADSGTLSDPSSKVSNCTRARGWARCLFPRWSLCSTLRARGSAGSCTTWDPPKENAIEPRAALLVGAFQTVTTLTAIKTRDVANRMVRIPNSASRQNRWRPLGDSNPRYRRERAVSWASRRRGPRDSCYTGRP